MTMNKNIENNIHFLQDYSIANIHRSKINEAAYNPRQMPDEHYRDLKGSIKRIKLREPLIWNKRSGNLVGGHQRLKVLDETWQSKHKNLDYKLTVAVVDLPQKEEIELNIALNNHRLMGIYDISKMNDILSSDTMPDIDLGVAGIKDEDLEIFGINMDLENIQHEEVDKAIHEFNMVKEQKNNEIPPAEKERKKEIVKNTKRNISKNEFDTYVTVSFSDQKSKRDFMRKIGEPEASLFIKGEIFVKKFFSE